jgi:quercetin dioxygenase-like cupin family protein
MDQSLATSARIITPEMWGPELPVIVGRGSCREVVGARSGATLRSLYHLELRELSATVVLRHPSEAVYYVVEGSAQVGADGAPQVTVPEGGMIHIRPETPYALSTVAGTRLIGGPCPVDPGFGQPLPPTSGAPDPEAGQGVRVFSRDEPGLLVPFISADARLVVWYGAGAVDANMNYVVLEPGERNKEHLHRYSEDTIFILEGHGTAEDLTNGLRLPFGPGDAVTIPPGVVHAVAADRGERVVSAGGPCPADLDMLRAVGVDVDRLTREMG